MLAVVIDDLGWGLPGTREAMDLDVPVTLAVLPGGPFSRAEADRARALGHEVILHLPMEPLSGGRSATGGTITTSMDETAIRATMLRHLDEVGPVAGFNNHTGSRATSDPRVAGVVVGVAAERGLYVLDSMTTGRSVLHAMAWRMGVPSAINGVFLDNEKDESYVRSRLALAAGLARSHGSLVAIGHVHPVTLKVLADSVADIEKMGIVFVKASRVVGAQSAPTLELADPRLR
jgi:polysaccharide deacetylase 2 family uncharacterized protein YibQ